MTRPPLMPEDTPDYMAPAWASAVEWAIGHEHVLAQFRNETGVSWKPGRTPLDQMIDKATGAERQFIESFVAWFNIAYWGHMGEPVERGANAAANQEALCTNPYPEGTDAHEQWIEGWHYYNDTDEDGEMTC